MHVDRRGTDFFAVSTCVSAVLGVLLFGAVFGSATLSGKTSQLVLTADPEQVTSKTVNSNIKSEFEKEDFGMLKSALLALSKEIQRVSQVGDTPEFRRSSLLKPFNGGLSGGKRNDVVDTSDYGSENNPAKSCDDLFEKEPSLPTGYYYIITIDGKVLRVVCEKPLAAADAAEPDSPPVANDIQTVDSYEKENNQASTPLPPSKKPLGVLAKGKAVPTRIQNIKTNPTTLEESEGESVPKAISAKGHKAAGPQISASRPKKLITTVQDPLFSRKSSVVSPSAKRVPSSGHDQIRLFRNNSLARVVHYFRLPSGGVKRSGGKYTHNNESHPSVPVWNKNNLEESMLLNSISKLISEDKKKKNQDFSKGDNLKGKIAAHSEKKGKIETSPGETRGTGAPRVKLIASNANKVRANTSRGKAVVGKTRVTRWKNASKAISLTEVNRRRGHTEHYPNKDKSSNKVIEDNTNAESKRKVVVTTLLPAQKTNLNTTHPHKEHAKNHLASFQPSPTNSTSNLGSGAKSDVIASSMGTVGKNEVFPVPTTNTATTAAIVSQSLVGFSTATGAASNGKQSEGRKPSVTVPDAIVTVPAVVTIVKTKPENKAGVSIAEGLKNSTLESGKHVISDVSIVDVTKVPSKRPTPSVSTNITAIIDGAQDIFLATDTTGEHLESNTDKSLNTNSQPDAEQVPSPAPDPAASTSEPNKMEISVTISKNGVDNLNQSDTEVAEGDQEQSISMEADVEKSTHLSAEREKTVEPTEGSEEVEDNQTPEMLIFLPPASRAKSPLKVSASLLEHSDIPTMNRTNGSSSTAGTFSGTSDRTEGDVPTDVLKGSHLSQLGNVSLNLELQLIQGMNRSSNNESKLKLEVYKPWGFPIPAETEEANAEGHDSQAVLGLHRLPFRLLKSQSGQSEVNVVPSSSDNQLSSDPAPQIPLVEEGTTNDDLINLMSVQGNGKLAQKEQPDNGTELARIQTAVKGPLAQDPEKEQSSPKTTTSPPRDAVSSSGDPPSVLDETINSELQKSEKTAHILKQKKAVFWKQNQEN